MRNYSSKYQSLLSIFDSYFTELDKEFQNDSLNVLIPLDNFLNKISEIKNYFEDTLQLKKDDSITFAIKTNNDLKETINSLCNKWIHIIPDSAFFDSCKSAFEESYKTYREIPNAYRRQKGIKNIHMMPLYNIMSLYCNWSQEYPPIIDSLKASSSDSNIIKSIETKLYIEKFVKNEMKIRDIINYIENCRLYFEFSDSITLTSESNSSHIRLKTYFRELKKLVCDSLHQDSLKIFICGHNGLTYNKFLEEYLFFGQNEEEAKVPLKNLALKRAHFIHNKLKEEGLDDFFISDSQKINNKINLFIMPESSVTFEVKNKELIYMTIRSKINVLTRKSEEDDIKCPLNRFN